MQNFNWEDDTLAHAMIYSANVICCDGWVEELRVGSRGWCMYAVILVMRPAICILALMRNSTGLVGCCQKIATSSGYLCILFHFVHMITPLATHLICQAWQSVPTNCSKALIGGCLNRRSFYKSVGILHQTHWIVCFRVSQKLSEAGS